MMVSCTVMKVISLFLGLLCAVPGGTADEILSKTGIKGGLVVHIGCGTGELTCSLRADNRYLIHGLDTCPEKVKKARTLIHSKNLYGAVAVDVFDGTSLPYADNLVNLVVSEALGRVDKEEIMRVLCPNGVALITRNGTWSLSRKPWPGAIDE